MQEVPDCFYRVSVKALVLNGEGGFLLTKKQNGFWDLPGGGLDFGEVPIKGLEREIMEEMGVKIKILNLNPVYFTTSQAKSGIWIANIIYNVELQDLNFTPSQECVDVKFFSKNEVSQEKVFLNVKAFSEQFVM